MRLARRGFVFRIFRTPHLNKTVKFNKMLKNYTTTIDASKSIAEIIDFIVDVGATDISQTFENKECVSIRFIISNMGNSIIYKLTANPDAAYAILIEQKKRINDEVRQKVKKQSFKTAWRILRDWIDSQCALIKLGQATPMQLFLSYAYDPNTDSTVYERLNEGSLKFLN